MSANFLSLPSELRNNVYEQVLVLREPIACPTQQGLERLQLQLGSLTLGLLRTNKAVRREASSILYAQNRFDFTVCTSEDVTSFLEQIGPNNASYIRHICVDFPKFHHLNPHDIGREDSVRSLEKIRRFKAISSLQEVIIEVNEDGLSDDIRREIENYGWTIRAASSLELSYTFIREENDPSPDGFKSAFFNLILHPKKHGCYMGYFTAGPFVVYEVLLYGPIARKPRQEYQLLDTLPVTSVSKIQLTPVSGTQPSVRREDSSLTREEWTEKFRSPTY